MDGKKISLACTAKTDVRMTSRPIRADGNKRANISMSGERSDHIR